MSKFGRVSPIGYACSPNGDKRYVWPEGGEWPDPGFPLSARHRLLDIDDVMLAVGCATEMEKKHAGAFNFSGFSHYEVYSCMLDRLLKKESRMLDDRVSYKLGRMASTLTEEQKKALFRNEFTRMIERGFSFDYMKGNEIPISQLDEYTERKVSNLLYSS
jgi:hypothetical protein